MIDLKQIKEFQSENATKIADMVSALGISGSSSTGSNKPVKVDEVFRLTGKILKNKKANDENCRLRLMTNRGYAIESTNFPNCGTTVEEVIAFALLASEEEQEYKVTKVTKGDSISYTREKSDGTTEDAKFTPLYYDIEEV